MRKVFKGSPIKLRFHFLYNGEEITSGFNPSVDIVKLSDGNIVDTKDLSWDGNENAYVRTYNVPEDAFGTYFAVAYGIYNGESITAVSREMFEVVDHGFTDLTTLDDVKAYLGIDDHSEDNIISELLHASSQAILSYIRTCIPPQLRTDNYHVQSQTSISLSRYPVLSIESVTVDDVQMDSSSYRLIPETGSIVFEEPVSGFLTIVYKYGLTEVPDDLQLACHKLVSVLYNFRNNEGYSSRRLLSEVDTYLSRSKLDVFAEIRALLTPYRRNLI